MLTLENALKAQVKNGRIIVDEPTDLPEGTELYLVPADTESDDMDDEERAELNAMLDESLEQMRDGKTIDGPTFVAKLRSRL